jgi:uroporphyrinogen decarboxylase
MMNHRERVIKSLSRDGYDRLPVRYMAEPVVTDTLYKHLGINDEEALYRHFGVDWRYVQPDYTAPPPESYPDGSRQLVWPERGWPVPATRYKDIPYSQGYYTEAVHRPFAEVREVEELDRYDFPSADWLDYSKVKQRCRQLSEYAIVTGTPGVLDFINGISHSRGVEQVLLDIGGLDPVYLSLIERKFEYHYSVIERTLAAAGGLINIVQTGEDLGTQLGPILSQERFDRLFADKYRVFFDMVHRYGAKVMLHSCGSVRQLLPRLIELGLDILDVVQVSAAGMEIEGLARDFGRDLAFCGTMCVQTMLPRLSATQIEEAVRIRRSLFPDGGLILGPSHSIQPDTPIENIIAMYEEALQGH